MKWLFVLAAIVALPAQATAWPAECCTDLEWAVYRQIPNHIRDMSDSAWFTSEFKKWAQSMPNGNVKDAYVKWLTWLEAERARLKITDERNAAIKDLADQVPVGACVSGYNPGTVPRAPEIRCQTMRQ